MIKEAEEALNALNQKKEKRKKKGKKTKKKKKKTEVKDKSSQDGSVKTLNNNLEENELNYDQKLFNVDLNTIWWLLI